MQKKPKFKSIIIVFTIIVHWCRFPAPFSVSCQKIKVSNVRICPKKWQKMHKSWQSLTLFQAKWLDFVQFPQKKSRANLLDARQKIAKKWLNTNFFKKKSQIQNVPFFFQIWLFFYCDFCQSKFLSAIWSVLMGVRNGGRCLVQTEEGSTPARTLYQSNWMLSESRRAIAPLLNPQNGLSRVPTMNRMMAQRPCFCLGLRLK